MKHFISLKEGTTYRPDCPLCHGNMQIDESYDIEINYEYRLDRGPKISLIWRHEQDEIEVDLETEHIIRHAVMSSYMGYIQPIGYTGSIGYHHPIGYTFQSIYNGVMYVRLVMSCKNCAMYHYMLQILVDMKRLRITDVILNSEQMTLLDNQNVVHVISNIYPAEQTEYQHGVRTASSSDEFKTITLPLVSMDLEHPYKTLERLKTLLTFL